MSRLVSTKWRVAQVAVIAAFLCLAADRVALAGYGSPEECYWAHVHHRSCWHPDAGWHEGQPRPGYYGSAAECAWAHANGRSCYHNAE